MSEAERPLYLREKFHRTRGELEDLRKLIRKLFQMFEHLLVDDQWPYEAQPAEQLELPADYSQSTNAMVLFAVASVAGEATETSPIVPTRSDDMALEFKEDVYRAALGRLSNETQDWHSDTSVHVTWSGSFGWDDPFTLTWLASFADKLNLTSRFRDRCRQRIREAFLGAGDPPKCIVWTPDPDAKKNWERETDHKHERLPERPSNRALDHVFPLLRFAHLAQIFPDRYKGEAKARAFFKRRLHEQLSRFEIPDGGFDASELVFALEGTLLLDRDSVGDALLERVAHVLSASQGSTPYWRPLKPFVARPQGFVLLPLSVETASSLLRCCRLLDERSPGENKGAAFFDANVGLFERYYEWLRARLYQSSKGATNASGEEIEFQGWHSEHVHLYDGIHVWETSQVLIYLIHYEASLTRHFRNRSLEAVNLRLETHPAETRGMEYWEKKREVSEPFAATEGPYQVYQGAGETFIRPRGFADSKPGRSILLYGPPGTGKSTFAEELCKALAWPLVTVTPSDFLHGGPDRIEARAKDIFDVLTAQRSLVVLFDEIDRFMVDRNHPSYGKQGDLFQFMTPSMLTKLRELNKAGRCIFLVATNYAERIDAAAKRGGRLDHHYLLPPPDKAGRQKILAQLVAKRVHPKDEAGREQLVGRLRESPDSWRILDAVAEKTPLRVFGELEQLVDESASPGQRNEQEILGALKAHTPAKDNEIQVASYRARFLNDGEGLVPGQLPWDELLVLLYLLAEVGPLPAQEVEFVTELHQAETLSQERIAELLGIDSGHRMAETLWRALEVALTARRSDD